MFEGKYIYSEDFPKEKFGDKSIVCDKGEIEFKNVSFGYNDTLVLDKVSLHIESNSINAIVGRSGAGKSTILSLINYLYSNYEGEISLDGFDIKSLDENSIRNNISIVNQTPYMFDLSIRDNLKLVNKDINDQIIWNVLDKVSLSEFVNSLDDKLDTVLGENGVSLSGGQRQRLAIARCLLKESKIIVFDEATSALDNNTQQEIVNVIEELKHDHTILIIAHRLTTIKSADKIYVLDKGRIVGEGTHKELIKNNKLYKELYDSEELNN